MRKEQKVKTVGESALVVVGAILGFVAFVLVLVSITAYPMMLLWNWLMPEIFGLPEINFLQALGLQILASLLIKSTPNSSSKKK